MGMPFNERSEEPRDPPPLEDSSSEDESQRESSQQEEQEFHAQEWYTTDDSDDWDDPSEGGVLTLVFRATEHGDEAELRQLLPSLSVPVDTPGNDRDTALHLASLYGHVGCAQLLLEHGHRADVTDEDGAMPLHDAAAGGYVEVVRLLLNKEPSVINIADNDGDTPLHNAARGGSLEVVSVLLLAGADPSILNAELKTPAGLVVSRDSDIYTLLQNHSAATASRDGGYDAREETEV